MRPARAGFSALSAAACAAALLPLVIFLEDELSVFIALDRDAIRFDPDACILTGTKGLSYAVGASSAVS